MGYGAPREGNAHRPRLADGGAPARSLGARFHGQHLRGHTQAAHDVSLRIMMIDGDQQSQGTVLAVNARYAGTKGEDRNFDSATTTGQMVEAFGGRRWGGLSRGRERTREIKGE